MSEKSLIEVKCKGCDAEFFVHPANPSELCHACKCFKMAMEAMMEPRTWERPKRMNPLLRCVLFSVAIVGPFWLLFIWLCLR